MTKRLYGLRGATGAENTAESITKGVCDMCTSLFKLNNIAPEDIVSIQFTMTEDLNAKNPASALRCGQNEIDVSACALFLQSRSFCPRHGERYDPRTRHRIHGRGRLRAPRIHKRSGNAAPRFFKKNYLTRFILLYSMCRPAAPI